MPRFNQARGFYDGMVPDAGPAPDGTRFLNDLAGWTVPPGTTLPWFETTETVVSGAIGSPGLLNPLVYNHLITSNGNAGLSYVRWNNGAAGAPVQGRQGIPFRIQLDTQTNVADVVQVGSLSADSIMFGPIFLGGTAFGPLCKLTSLHDGIVGMAFDHTSDDTFNILWVHSLLGPQTCLYTINGDLIDSLNINVGQFPTIERVQVCSSSSLNVHVDTTLYNTSLQFTSGIGRTIHIPTGWWSGQRKVISVNNNSGIVSTLNSGEANYAGPTVALSSVNDYVLLEFNTGPNNPATLGNPVSAAAYTATGTNKWRLIGGKGALSGVY